MGQKEESAEALLAHAVLLVELRFTHDAEIQVAELLDRYSDDLDALSLYAKIKHIRGELSQAIACWAQLHARALYHERALMELKALLALADDPERGVSEFLVVGHNQLLRKPGGHLALEEAFTLFRAHRPDEARARCIEIAARYRASDPATYKLAILGVAWIAELSGGLEEAARFLERLGRERGFEHDTDRLLALARVYEQLGEPDRLRAALRICRHLDRELGRAGVQKISLLARMAQLFRRLGEDEQAEELDRRYLAAFRRRAHRPSLTDAVGVAARTYVPLSRLTAISLPPPPPPRDAERRALALAAAIEGDRETARRLLRPARDPLDTRYLADLAALDGDQEEAAALYLQALSADSGDPHLIGWLIEHADRSPASPARDYLRGDGFPIARAGLEATLARAPRRPSAWRHLGMLLQIAGREEDARRCAANAERLLTADARDARPIGRILSASVYHFVGRAKGLIHEIWAHRHPVAPGTGGLLRSDQILGNLTDEMKENVRNVFLAVREYAQSVFPDQVQDLFDYEYTFKVPKEDEQSGGSSAGLASALVFLSVFLQRPIPQDLAFTGIVVADAHDVLIVRPVGEIDYKVKAAYNRNLRGVVVPTGNRPELEMSRRVPGPICKELVRYVASVDQAVALVWRDPL